MVLDLLHVDSKLAQIFNEGVLLVHHRFNLLFCLKITVSWLIQVQLVHLHGHVPRGT